ANEEHLAIGEISHYLFQEGNAEKIKRYNPEMKMIINLRDPIERQISYFLFKTGRAGCRSDSLIRFLENDEIAQREKEYSDPLKRFLSHFSPKQFLIFDFDLIAENPREYVLALCSFLDCPLFEYSEELLKKRVFEYKKPNWKIVNYLLFYSAQAARKLGLQTLVGRLKHSDTLEKWLYRQGLSKIEFSENQKNLLKDSLRKDVRQLRDILPVFEN